MSTFKYFESACSHVLSNRSQSVIWPSWKGLSMAMSSLKFAMSKLYTFFPSFVAPPDEEELSPLP